MKCTKCDEEIDEDEDNIVEAVISSIQRFCHLHCFRCSICADQLSGWYFEKNGELFCRKDYYHCFGERCRHCQSVMSGPVMVVAGVGEVKFHPECFKCTACSSIIGDDESYAYVEQSQLYCNGCFCPNTPKTITKDIEHSGHEHLSSDAPPDLMDKESIRRSQLPPQPDGLPRCYTIAASSAKESTLNRQSLTSNSISSMKKLNALRPNSATTTTVTEECSATNGDIDTTNTNGTTMTPNSKSIDNIRKSRSLEKRQRNRERSSSLSRLLETIRLGSTETATSPSTNCEVNGDCRSSSQSTSSTSSSSSPFHPANNHHQLTMSHSQSSSYFPTRNGLQLGSHYRDKAANNSLSRTKSFRVEPKAYRIFRASDLVKGVLLGRGFFGEVFEVTDKVTQEKMVLKELYHNDREAEANFVREVSILKSLSHKNVLQFIGILYRGKKLNMITEYITGGTLRQLIQEESRPIWWLERLAWARDIASGVNYLHSMSLIHRDLNSQNCLVREDGTVVVADFGLSKITSVNGASAPVESLPTTTTVDSGNGENNQQLNANQLAKLNRRRDRRKRYTIVGNPFWMAPEMMHRNKYDERVDIYSFGIILLEIIGSVNADPDVLKRNRDFSVDRKHFLENYVKKSCPEIFWRIAFLCTEMNPDMRPPFHVLERWFQLICSSLHNCHHSQQNDTPDSLFPLVSPVSVEHNYQHNHQHQQCPSSGHIPVEIINEVANYNSSGQQQLSGSQTMSSNSLLSDTAA